MTNSIPRCNLFLWERETENMRIKRFYGVILGIIVWGFVCAGQVHAETIYCKDGTVVRGKIQYRSMCSVWLKNNIGAFGISLTDVEKIINDDKTISKYDLRSLYKKSLAYIKEGNYAEAVRLYTILLETFPRDKSLHYLRGMLNQEIGELDKARDDYMFLVSQDAADANILNNIGIICARQQRYKEALKWLDRAIKKDPQRALIRNNLADVLFEMKDYDKAIPEYTRVIRLKPDSVEALYNLGFIYFERGNDNRARNMWKKIISFDPGDKNALNALAYLKAKEQKKLLEQQKKGRAL